MFIFLYGIDCIVVMFFFLVIFCIWMFKCLIDWFFLFFKNFFISEIINLNILFLFMVEKDFDNVFIFFVVYCSF